MEKDDDPWKDGGNETDPWKGKEKQDDPWSDKSAGKEDPWSDKSIEKEVDPWKDKNGAKENNSWDSNTAIDAWDVEDVDSDGFPVKKDSLVTKKSVEKQGAALVKCTLDSCTPVGPITVLSAVGGAYLLTRRIPLVRAGKLPFRSIFNVLVGGYFVGRLGDLLYGFNVTCRTLRNDFMRASTELKKREGSMPPKAPN